MTPCQNWLRLPDEVALAFYDWPTPKGSVRGQVLIVHGLGEHARRYDEVARRLSDWGFAVRAYDQRGHGLSEGRRGVLPGDDALTSDLWEVVNATRVQGGDAPLILLGHSLGGLVAASHVQQNPGSVDGLILSSPALDAGLGLIDKVLIALMYRIAPSLTLSNRLDVNKISHDPEVVRAYLADPLVHDRISARLARFIQRQGAVVSDAAEQWAVPTLLMYAGDDHLVRAAGSAAFAAAAPSNLLQAVRLDGRYHEIFNELDPSDAYAALGQWLDERWPL